MFGRTADETTRMLEESMDVESLDVLEATVEQMTRDRFGKLSITLSNRQTWKQSDSSRMNLRVGDEVHIKRAALGSYLLEKKSGSTSIRVKRIE
jgi:outer membrane usher protein FimD/PapC